MNIQVFNLLEDNFKIIVDGLIEELKHRNATYGAWSDKDLRSLIEKFVDRYVDHLVTGQMDNSDVVLRALATVVAIQGPSSNALLELPSLLGASIRRLVIDEYLKLQAEQNIRKMDQALEQIEATINLELFALLEMFQDRVHKDGDELKDDLALVLKELEIAASARTGA
jgi:hypothetical protein